MDFWFLVIQLGVGVCGALVFLSALADGFLHEEHLSIIRKRRWDREHLEEGGEVIEIAPQPDAVTIPPAS